MEDTRHSTQDDETKIRAVAVDYIAGVLEADPARMERCLHPDLALLWQFRLSGVDQDFFTVRASPGWRPREDVEDGLPDGRHARLWRRSADSFFSVPPL